MSRPDRKLTKHQIAVEQSDLFQQAWVMLYKEEEELREHFNVARNLACSEWSPDNIGGRMGPHKMLPDTMKLLMENFDMLLDEISRKRYYLMVAFEPFLKKAGHWPTEQECDCFEYWNEKLKLVDTKKKRRPVQMTN